MDLEIIGLSLAVALVATALNLPLGVAFGWLFARKRFPGKALLDALVNAPLVLPPVVTGYILLVVLGPRGGIGGYLERWFGFSLAFTWKAAVVASAVVSLPLLVRAVHVSVDAVDAKLEDAGRTLGAGGWGIFFTITLPLSLPGIVAGAALGFARALGEFGATIMFAGNLVGKTQTIPLAIFTYLNQPGGEAKARVLVMVAIVFSYVSILLNEWLLRRIRNSPPGA